MNFDQLQMSDAPKVMLNAVTAKFEQNDNLKAFLTQTGESQIVEANQSDTFWSCDWSLCEPDKIKNTWRWPGKN